MICCHIKLYTATSLVSVTIYCHIKLHTANPLVSVMIYSHIKLHTATSLSIRHDILSYQAVYITQYQCIRFYNAEGLYLGQYVKTYCPGKPHTSVIRHTVVSVTSYCCNELCTLSVLYTVAQSCISKNIHPHKAVCCNIRLYSIHMYYSAS